MIQPFLNWRTFITLIAIGIVIGTVFYSGYMARKIGQEERQKVEEWVAASKAVLNSNQDLTLPNLIRNGQQNIPIIETNERDSITGYANLDSIRTISDKGFLSSELKKFKSEHAPILIKLTDSPYTANKYYYGHTLLLEEVRYYPFVQLFIVALFIFFTVYSITVRNKATQNQLWAGMAKETAHQLGTPVSSLEGWVEVLKESETDPRMVSEIKKDVDRLKLITDRFGKIGSRPKLEMKDLIYQLQQMVDYIKRRSSEKVHFSMDSHGNLELFAEISPPLFDWVIENLLKNALDAMEGKGEIRIEIQKTEKEIHIDVSDTGKGISKYNLQRVFKPGFTTKKRGWGLGLSLSKRIVEEYHNGKLFIRHSEPGKGTIFRIELKG